MPRASSVPPDPARQDWGVFEPPNPLDSPRDIAGETEGERRKEAFKNVMRAAALLYETDPRGLVDLVRLLGREEQSYRMALALSFPGNILSEYLLEPNDLWFGSREPLNEAGERFEDLAPQVEAAEPLSLAKDLVMPGPWSKERLLDVVPRIGEGREWGPFRQDPNHQVELWLPVRVAWVFGGNHSITAGILRAQGELRTTIVRDLDQLYDHVACDGEEFFRLHDKSTIDSVSDHQWAAIFEIGRYLREAKRRGCLQKERFEALTALYAQAPKKIVVCCNGNMKQSVEGNWNGYKQQHADPGSIELDFWGGDKLAALIQQHFLHEYLFPELARKKMRKTIAHADQNEEDPHHFYSLVHETLFERDLPTGDTQSTRRRRLHALRLLDLSLNIVFHWCQEADNLRPALLCAERAVLLYPQSWVREESSQNHSSYAGLNV